MLLQAKSGRAYLTSPTRTFDDSFKQPCLELGVLHFETNPTAQQLRGPAPASSRSYSPPVMFLRDKFCFAVLLSFICSAQSQEEKFAGNLIPDSNADSDHTTADDDDGSERTSSVVGTNLTGSPDEVNGAPSIPESADSPPEKRSVKKAARPPGKPESVGFIPPPEEEGKGSEEEEAEERQMVMSIPTLPARLI